MAGLLDWIRSHEALLFWLGTISVVMFVGSLVIAPILIARIPADYFAHSRPRKSHFASAHPIIRIVLVCVRNALGVVLVVAGIAMLVLPGQGILTILLGISLLQFPGKYTGERWFVRRRAVRRALNWIRRRAGREPLVFDEHDP